MKMTKIILLGLALMFVTGCGCTSKEAAKEEKTNTLEKTMTSYVKSFYEKNIKDYASGITEQQVTIAILKQMDYDTSKLKNPTTGKLCDEESYALVKIEDSTDVANSKYTIENHLVCGDYKSEK